MAAFSDLPNELIISIWGYVIEPESVENFALVSKRLYELATPFVEEHQRLRQRYAKICNLGGVKDGRAADLLEVILLNPRIAVYINELQLQSWANCWDDQDNSLQTHSYAGKTMEVFEDAIRSLSLITSSEADDWVKNIKSGHEGPILALILIRLIELKKLEICPLYYDLDGALDLVLGGWSRSLGTFAHAKRSSTESKRHHGNGEFLQLPKLSQISDLVISFCDIELRTISQLLGSTRKLKRFSYYGSSTCSVKPSQVCNVLLECSQQSLQKLRLEFNSELEFGENHSFITDTLSRFERLVELEMDIVFLLSSEDDDCNTLIDMLPTSIEKVTFASTMSIAFETIRSVILRMVKSKVVYLPNLKALTFEQSLYQGFQDDTTALVIGIELRDTELFAELSRKSAEVGVVLSVTKPDYPMFRNDRVAFRVYMS